MPNIFIIVQLGCKRVEVRSCVEHKLTRPLSPLRFVRQPTGVLNNYTLFMKNSKLIQLAQTANVNGQSKLTWLYEPLVFVYAVVSLFVVSMIFMLPIVFYMMFSAGVNPLELEKLITSPQSPSLAFGILFSSFIGIYLAVWGWLWLMERRPYYTLGLERKGAVWQYVRGLLIGIGFLLLVTGILAMMGMVAWESPFQGLSSRVLIGVGLLFLGFVVQGAAEEVLVRGFLLPILARRYSIWTSIIVSSLFFAILHLLNPNLSLIAVLNLFLAGVFFAVYALKEGSLWGACGVHTTWNWTMGHILGFEVSGSSFGGPDSILFDLKETGPDWITGGMFGPEGGVVVTVIIVLATVFIYSRPTTEGDNQILNGEAV
ncbi:MAG: membrane protease YdiL (CAAX protease family) [Cellvibrionaceae bacterium]|jgi:membrane protease YdiL (CAAX protease family)